MSKSLENVVGYAAQARVKYPMIDLGVVRSEYFFGQEEYKDTHDILPGLAGAMDFIQAAEDAGALQAARYVHGVIRNSGITYSPLIGRDDVKAVNDQ